MEKCKKKSLQNNKNNYNNKSHIKCGKEISSIKFNFISLKLLLLIIFYNFIPLTQENPLKMRRLDSSYNITMVIQGPGEHKFLGDYFAFSPTDVIINGETIGWNNNNSYNFENTTNIVTLIFDKDINSTNGMFKDVVSVLEIDLSKFDSSNIINTTYMFYNCNNLKSINIQNFNTTNVEDMYSTFYKCSSLLSLNLSNFDTSKVTRMSLMFSDCKNLISLDISNFNTSNVQYMNSMFSECQQLTSLNIQNFNTINVRDMYSTFYK